MMDMPPPAVFAPPLVRRLLAVLVAVTATAILLAPVRHNGFINRDDPDYVTGNLLIRDFSPAGVAKIFATPEFMGNYHPLTLTLLAAEYLGFRQNEEPYHTVSLILHLVATALVVVLARRLTGSDLAAFGTGLLFGVHPLHVESVAWVSEQKDLLYGVFYLAGLLAYVRYVRNGFRPTAYAATLVLFILSLLSKAMAASFPVALWLIDALHDRAFDRRALREKIPFALLSIGFGLFAIYAQSLSGAIVDANRVPFFSRIAVALVALPRYMFKLVVPANLSAFYPYPDVSPGGIWLEVTGSIALLAVLAYLTWRLAERLGPLVWFGLALFLATVALVLQLLPVGGAMMADRYMYLPSFGFLLAAVSLAERLTANRRRGKVILAAALVAAALALSAVTQARVAVWRDSVTLWTDVIARYPSLSFPYVYRANARELPRESGAVLADIGRALEIDPALGFGYYSRAYALASLGEHERAVADYTKALTFSYDSAQTLNGLGSSLTALGLYAEAARDYSRAISLKPGVPEPYFNRGNIFALQGDYGRAIADYDTVLRLDPSDGEAMAHRGLARVRAGDRTGGCEDLRRAAAAGVGKAAEAAAAYCN